MRRLSAAAMLIATLTIGLKTDAQKVDARIRYDEEIGFLTRWRFEGTGQMLVGNHNSPWRAAVVESRALFKAGALIDIVGKLRLGFAGYASSDNTDCEWSLGEGLRIENRPHRRLRMQHCAMLEQRKMTYRPSHIKKSSSRIMYSLALRHDLGRQQKLFVGASGRIFGNMKSEYKPANLFQYAAVGVALGWHLNDRIDAGFDYTYHMADSKHITFGEQNRLNSFEFFFRHRIEL